MPARLLRVTLSQLQALQKRLTGGPPRLAEKAGRQLLHEGPLMKVCRKEPKPRYFVLLSDLLLYGTAPDVPAAADEGSPPPAPKVSVHACLELERTSVEEDVPNAPLAFQILSSPKSFVVFAATAEARAEWIRHLRQALSVLHATRASQGSSLHAPVWVPDKVRHLSGAAPGPFRSPARTDGAGLPELPGRLHRHPPPPPLPPLRYALPARCAS